MSSASNRDRVANLKKATDGADLLRRLSEPPITPAKIRPERGIWHYIIIVCGILQVISIIPPVMAFTHVGDLRALLFYIVVYAALLKIPPISYRCHFTHMAAGFDYQGPDARHLAVSKCYQHSLFDFSVDCSSYYKCMALSS